MAHEIHGATATDLYLEGLQHFRVSGVRESSRNGPVLRLPGLTLLELDEPMCRVLDDPTRNANPFFHLMEFVWMMAGKNDVAWLSKFNKRMVTYADNGILNAAYGHRWRYEFGVDQLETVVDSLNASSTTRQAVLAMWHPGLDNQPGVHDRACNISIVFSNNAGALDMVVYNRSNDFIWGALGANIVHMTLLHETIAHMTGIHLGKYQVVSANMHIYTNMEGYPKIAQQIVANEIYNQVLTEPMFTSEERDIRKFLMDCEDFCEEKYEKISTVWLHEVALPAKMAWEAKWSNYEGALQWCEKIVPADWRIACINWLKRYAVKSAT